MLDRTLILNDPPAKTRVDYASLRTVDIYRKLGEYGAKQEEAETDFEWCEASFAIQELSAVLQDRGGR